MQGLQKPVLYLLNSDKKGKLPFDIDDQIYIEHTDGNSLLAGLDNKIPLLIDKLRLLSGFESAQRRLVKEKVNLLSQESKLLLKRLILEGSINLRSEDFSNFVNKDLNTDLSYLIELKKQRFIADELVSGGTRTLQYTRINEAYRKYLEEILW